MHQDRKDYPYLVQCFLDYGSAETRKDSEVINDLVALALVLHAHDIPDPRLRPVVLPPDWP